MCRAFAACVLVIDAAVLVVVLDEIVTSWGVFCVGVSVYFVVYLITR